MEQRLRQMQERDNRMKREKELSMQQILNEEKKVLEARYFDELQKIQKQSANNARNVAVEAMQHKNKNEKLSGAVLEKEADILNL